MRKSCVATSVYNIIIINGHDELYCYKRKWVLTKLMCSLKPNYLVPTFTLNLFKASVTGPLDSVGPGHLKLEIDKFPYETYNMIL